MFWIILLVVLGVLFLLAELLILQGLSIGAILALVCYGIASYMAFTRFGTVAGWSVIAAIVVISLVATIIACRSKTWRGLTLLQDITSSSMDMPQDHSVQIGARGVAVTRLAPMGKVEIDGRIFEAKAISEYVDQKSRVEVIGFENFNVIVKRINE